MEAIVSVFEPFLIDVGVNLRGGNVGVTQHLLDDPHVAAIARSARRMSYRAGTVEKSRVVSAYA
jgi:hypothetical protein